MTAVAKIIGRTEQRTGRLRWSVVYQPETGGVRRVDKVLEEEFLIQHHSEHQGVVPWVEYDWREVPTVGAIP